MSEKWLKSEPDRLSQFSSHGDISNKDLLEHVKNCKNKFYAHFFIRYTHRPWGQTERLLNHFDRKNFGWPYDAYCSRRAALEKPDELAGIRRQGLEYADQMVQEIFEATSGIDDTAYVVYSNHD
jgi:hypothetical protein